MPILLFYLFVKKSLIKEEARSSMYVHKFSPHWKWLCNQRRLCIASLITTLWAKIATEEGWNFTNDFIYPNYLSVYFTFIKDLTLGIAPSNNCTILIQFGFSAPGTLKLNRSYIIRAEFTFTQPINGSFRSRYVLFELQSYFLNKYARWKCV